MKTNNQNPVVRIAPSPTGYMHIGTARTALFNFLFAKKHGGRFILRIEDTDTTRNKKEYEDNIIEGLEWLGLTWDNADFYRQSERKEIYKKYLKKLVDEEKAYISKEEIKKEGDREEIIRFKNPNTKIKFNDIIRGDIEFDTTELGDFVIAKSLEEPLYHLAVAVDDFEMGITHVIRGEDHISNTPRQILILEGIGAPRPKYAHIPLILAPDRSKLSKRHGAISLLEYREMGYLPEAIVNYLALLGWNPGTNDESFSLKKLIELFDLEKVQKGGAIFNIEKLKWINREYLKNKTEEIKKIIFQVTKITDEITLRKLLILVAGRISTTGEIEGLFNGGELGFLKTPDYQKEKLIWKDSNEVNAKQHLTKIIETLNDVSEETFKNSESTKALIWEYAEREGRGNVLWPMRYALTGKDKSPDPFTVASILGKIETLNRLKIAIEKLHE
ncbi:MAG: glutamate--tRNA ligase [Candidatus Lloydbacteria bacterium RIFCSPHIGHO2_01_FULL_41_20]|uniref:Glutamate--tRNA ligase n=1 Tax=Candidatus Lloydbacteria bacterium RIFCSPHIGHO2_01_FULL_41_20 TaxID=1798657 RepID=A0A1G2CQW7_9BACT|nr:MAG: glutamate--tRNA ligase [Candidatus Lloydbacteria bacterium RIFCSPHIGHO2_01_FULL_41_20]